MTKYLVIYYFNNYGDDTTMQQHRIKMDHNLDKNYNQFIEAQADTIEIFDEREESHND